MASTIILSDNGASSGSAGVKTTGGNDGKLILQTTTSGGTATSALTIDTSQNVGIGTSSPAAKLHVAGSSATDFNALTLRNGDGTTGSAAVLGFEASSGTLGDAASLAGQIKGIRTGGGTSGALAFWTNNAGTPTERARIDSSGNLLVGTTTVNGAGGFSIRPNVSNGSASTYFNRTSTASVSYPIVFQNGGSDVGWISYTNTAVTYATSSDYRLKENIAPMTGALSVVQQLKPCTYTWKGDGSDGQGFIAHELQEIVPDCVTGEKDAVDADGNPVYQGIDTSFLVATLTAAIQEQQALITTLTERITALEAK